MNVHNNTQISFRLQQFYTNRTMWHRADKPASRLQVTPHENIVINNITLQTHTEHNLQPIQRHANRNNQRNVKLKT